MNTTNEKILSAFNHALEEFQKLMETTEQSLKPTVDEMVQNASKISRQVYALTQDESKLISDQLSKELKHLKQYLRSEGKEVSQWLDFDLQMVEDRFVEVALSAADKVWLDFKKFEEDVQNPPVYQTGEICSAGTLICTQCNKTLTFTRTSHIPPCSGCHGTHFRRKIT